MSAEGGRARAGRGEGRPGGVVQARARAEAREAASARDEIAETAPERSPTSPRVCAASTAPRATPRSRTRSRRGRAARKRPRTLAQSRASGGRACGASRPRVGSVFGVPLRVCALSGPRVVLPGLRGRASRARLVVRGGVERARGVSVRAPRLRRRGPAAELRVLLFGEGARRRWTRCALGAAVLPASAVLARLDRTRDGWLDVFGASAGNTAADLQDVEYRVRLKPTRARGRVRKARGACARPPGSDAPRSGTCGSPRARSGRGGGDKTHARRGHPRRRRLARASTRRSSRPSPRRSRRWRRRSSPHDAWLRRRGWIAWHALVELRSARASRLQAARDARRRHARYADARARGTCDSPARPTGGARVARGFRDGRRMRPMRARRSEPDAEAEAVVAIDDGGSRDPIRARRPPREGPSARSRLAASGGLTRWRLPASRESEAETRRLRVLEVAEGAPRSPQQGSAGAATPRRGRRALRARDVDPRRSRARPPRARRGGPAGRSAAAIASAADVSLRGRRRAHPVAPEAPAATVRR